jgi:hypothetical protein
MSNPQTFYKVGGVDLSNIFQPLSLGTQYPNATGYKIGNQDFNSIFAAYTSGAKAALTGYTVTGLGDLNNIFAQYNPLPFTATGNYSYSYANGYYTIISSPITGFSTITFLQNLNNVNISIVGGGGGGASTPAPSLSYNFYGSGGGGGGQALLKYNVLANSTYNIAVGSGGPPGPNAGSGNSTIFDIFTVGGGSPGTDGSNLSSFDSSQITPNLGGAGGAGTSTPSTTNKTVIYTGNGGSGGAGGVNPWLSGGITYQNTNISLNWAQVGFDSSFYTNSKILCVPTTLSNYSGGGAGSASNSGSGGNGSGGNPSTSSTTINGQVPGAGGGAVNYPANSGGIGADGTCVIYFQYPQQTPPFTFSNSNYNYQYIGGYYYITFMSSGTFTPTINISNTIIIAVGGGGGGGGGNGAANDSSAGGSGGGAGVITGIYLTNTNYNITVGAGGVGGNSAAGTNGGTSAFSNYIISSGGSGGYIQNTDGDGPYVIAGSTIAITTLYGGGTGNGGNGGYANVQTNFFGGNGLPSEIYGFNSNTGYILPNGNKIYFSGGGGGGKSGTSSVCQGGAPGNGYGGAFGYGSNFITWPVNNNPAQYPPINSLNGLDAVLYGAGGGGGSENRGGNGGPGIVMVIFQYP